MGNEIRREDRPPKKRLAVFIDGTWNVEDNNTNVWRMYSLCSSTADDGCQQVCYYTKGVGTAYGSKIRGGWFGEGLSHIITEAYGWLISRYQEGDEIFVFGFSRGAYAARSLAGFIALCGIIKPGSPIGIGELFDRSQKGEASRTLYRLLELQSGDTLENLSLLERWMIKYSVPAKVTMVGVWDTVGALRGQKGYLETGLRIPIENAFHALAIDEHREKFTPTLWTINTHLDRPAERPHRDIANVEQRWFVGSHANVGGGYNSDLLPQLPLRWLMRKASSLKLTFRESVDLDDEVYKSVIRNSFGEFAYGLYQASKFFRPFYRMIGSDAVTVGQTRTSYVNETIDQSVFERWRRDANYRPINLMRWFKNKATNPKYLTSSVTAADPSIFVSD